MSKNDTRSRGELSPGEARTRQRQRRQAIYLGIAALIGGTIGFFTGFFDQGDGNLFAGDWEDLALPPLVAIFLMIGLLFGFLALPLWGFTQVDDFQREHSFVGFTGGALGVLAGFPVWAVLYAGGFVPPPHAFGIYAICFVSMLASFAFAKFRS